MENLKWLAAHSLTIPWVDPTPTPDAETDDDGDEGGEEAEADAMEAEEEKKAPTPPTARPSLVALRAMVDQSQRNRGLNWAFHRLSYMARQPGHVKRGAILAFYRHVVEQLPVAAYAPYLLPLLHALFRMANQCDYNAEVEAEKAQAAEVLEALQQRVDRGVFLAYYNAVRGGVMEVRRGEAGEAEAAGGHTAGSACEEEGVRSRGGRRRGRKRRMEGVKLAKGIAGIRRIDRPRAEAAAPVAKRQKRSGP